jgi:hypothetical protein
VYTIKWILYDENVTKHAIVHCLPPLEVMIRNAAFPTAVLLAIWF